VRSMQPWKQTETGTEVPSLTFLRPYGGYSSPIRTSPTSEIVPGTSPHRPMRMRSPRRVEPSDRRRSAQRDSQLRRSAARARGVLASASAGPRSAQREGRPLSYSLRSPSADAVAGERRSERFDLTCIACHGQPASDRAGTGRDYLEEDIADDRRSCNGRDRPPTTYWLSRSRTQPHRRWAFGRSTTGRPGC
jgi:hypothetical protein